MHKLLVPSGKDPATRCVTYKCMLAGENNANENITAGLVDLLKMDYKKMKWKGENSPTKEKNTKYHLRQFGHVYKRPKHPCTKHLSVRSWMNYGKGEPWNAAARKDTTLWNGREHGFYRIERIELIKLINRDND